jgi:competence protein ComEC
MWEEWLYPQWVMYGCLMPILVYVFHEFSVISLLTNFIAMPFMMLAVIPLALLGGIVLFIAPPLGHCLFVASDWVMRGLWVILQWGTDLPHSIVFLPEPSLFAVILSLCGCLLLFAPRGVRGRWLSIFLFLPLFLPKTEVPTGQVQVTSLHLQTGSAMIFETAHHVILVQNIQHLREAKSSIHSVIEPYLQMHGQHEISLWIINGSKDYHAVQSLENTWSTTTVDRIILPYQPKTFDSAILSCQTTQKWPLDGVVFITQANETSCSLKY